MNVEPTVLWGAAVAVAGFLAYLIKDYIATLKADRDAWRDMAMRGLTVAEKAVPVAEKVIPIQRRRPTLSASAAARAREAVKRSSRDAS